MLHFRELIVMRERILLGGAGKEPMALAAPVMSHCPRGVKPETGPHWGWGWGAEGTRGAHREQESGQESKVKVAQFL